MNRENALDEVASCSPANLGQQKSPLRLYVVFIALRAVPARDTRGRTNPSDYPIRRESL